VERGHIGDFCLRPVYEEYDAAEISLSWYLMARSRHEPIIALPIFPLRMWVHAYFYCRDDSPFSHPRDLVGKRVGTSRYRITVNLWLRGILKEHYGVNPQDFLWVTTEEEGAGFDVPAEISLTPLPGENPEELLLKGEVDALCLARSTRRGEGRIRQLFPHCRSEVDKYFQRTGIFPITHTVVMNEALWNRDPWVAERLVTAFKDAQAECERFYAEPKHLTLASAVFVREEERSAFGPNPWVQGLEANRKTLETFARYAYEQGYIPRQPVLEDLFARNTLSM
jgi:4,5-dihydroxyphthalate decarboxylase